MTPANRPRGHRSKSPPESQKAPSLRKKPSNRPSPTPGAATAKRTERKRLPTAEELAKAVHVHEGTDHRSHAGAGQTSATYCYEDQAGDPVFYVCRTEVEDADGTVRKSFSQWRHGKPGRRGEVPSLPYHLPQLVDLSPGTRVHVAEGEKDVLALEHVGEVATCAAGGAGKWTDAHTKFLGEVEVMIWADKDGPGRNHAAKVAATLDRADVPYRVVEAKTGKDAYDHLAAGHAVAEAVPVTHLPLVGGNASTGPDEVEGKLPTNAKVLLADALTMAKGDVSRNEAGLWLGCQLRDNGLVDVGEQVMFLYQELVCGWKDPPYTVQEAMDTWRSVLSEPARGSSLPKELDELEREVTDGLAMTQGDDERRDYIATALTDEDLFAMAPPEWLVEDFLPAEGVVVVWGQPGIGKTFLMLATAQAVRRGTSWFGQATQRGSVVFFAGEGLGDVGPRLRAHQRLHRPLRREAPVSWQEQPLNLNDPRQVAAVIRAGRQLADDSGERVRLVVLDPLIEFMTGDENADGMDQASRALRVIARTLGCCVLVGHHGNASGERARGNDKLRARVHAMFKMERIAAGTSGVVAEKQRNGPHMALKLQLVPSAESVVFIDEWTGEAQDYRSAREAEKEGRKKRRETERSATARSLVLKVVGDTQDLGKNQILAAARDLGDGEVGTSAIRAALELLVEQGDVVVTDAPNRKQMHRLAGDQVSS